MRRATCWMLVLPAACVALPEADRDDVVADVAGRMRQELPREAEAGARIGELLDDGVLTADESVRLAICNNPGLRAAFEELEIARAHVLDAVLPSNPMLDAELQFVESGGGDLLELAVTQSIVDLLLIPMRRQVAEARFARVQAEVTAAVVDLAIEVRTTFRRLQAQQDMVELNHTAADATWLALDAARRLFDAGNIKELDLLTEQAEHEAVRIALSEARARAAALRDAMNVLLGLHGEQAQAWRIDGRLPPPAELAVSAGDVERRVVAQSLDLDAARHALMAAGHACGLQRLEVLLGGAAAGAKAEREPGETWSGGPVVALPLPVFDYGQAVSRETAARLRRSYERYTDTAIRVRSAARAAFVVASSSAESGRYLFEVLLPLRRRITERTQEQVNAMQLGVFQLLRARRRELDAGRSYVRALRAHWISRARLEAMLLGRMPQERFGIDVGGASAGLEMGPPGDGGGH